MTMQFYLELIYSTKHFINRNETMITSTPADTQDILDSKIYTCMTYYSNKLGPRLVGTAEDWDLVTFSKDALFSIVHDSMLLRTKRALLFTEDLLGVKYRVYVSQYKMNFTDYHYEGTKYAICFFIPDHISSQVEIRNAMALFNWTDYISANGSAKNLKNELLSKIEFH